jgi:hypothetical protein
MSLPVADPKQHAERTRMAIAIAWGSCSESLLDARGKAAVQQGIRPSSRSVARPLNSGMLASANGKTNGD